MFCEFCMTSVVISFVGLFLVLFYGSDFSERFGDGSRVFFRLRSWRIRV